MPLTCPDIVTFKADLDGILNVIRTFNYTTHSGIKIRSLLNVTAYAYSCRFLEGSVKHLVFNCCQIRGDTQTQLATLHSELKKFNNPTFDRICDLYNAQLQYDIIQGKIVNRYSDTDITFLNQIVNNRHRNVHASENSGEWLNSNQKDITDLIKELIGLLNILEYLDAITWNPALRVFYV
jgi:hypothetical protein